MVVREHGMVASQLWLVHFEGTWLVLQQPFNHQSPTINQHSKCENERGLAAARKARKELGCDQPRSVSRCPRLFTCAPSAIQPPPGHALTAQRSESAHSQPTPTISGFHPPFRQFHPQQRINRRVNNQISCLPAIQRPPETSRIGAHPTHAGGPHAMPR